MKEAIRFISMLAFLSSGAFLLTHYAFVFLCPSLLKTWAYPTAQIVAQAALAFLLMERVIVIYT